MARLCNVVPQNALLLIRTFTQLKIIVWGERGRGEGCRPGRIARPL